MIQNIDYIHYWNTNEHLICHVLLWTKYCWSLGHKMMRMQLPFSCSVGMQWINPKRARGAESAPPRHFMLYLSRLLLPVVAQFKTIFKKIGPRVMTWRCIIKRWVQQKTDQKLIFNGNYTQIVFFVFRIHFPYVLSYLFGLFGVRTCVSILWHTSLPKNATSLEK